MKPNRSNTACLSLVHTSYLQVAEVVEVAECKFWVGAVVYEKFDQLDVSPSHDLSSNDLIMATVEP